MVGKSIKKFREQKGMSQEQLAEKVNVTRQAVSNWELDKCQPDLSMLHAISQVLEVTVEEIIYGAQKPHTTIVNKTIQPIVETSVGVGSALAMIISYVKWQSIGWALLHCLFSWGYVIYYIIRYGWS